MFWERERLNAEVDGYQWHRYRRERDLIRDAELQGQGIRVMRISWRQLSTEPEAVLVRLAQALTAGFAPRSAAGP
jgi:very-short-patch-repair endonuclease